MKLRSIGLSILVMNGIIFGAILLIIYPVISMVYNVKDLKEEYVQVSSSNSTVVYEITKNRPKDWVLITEVSKFVPAAIITSEDGKFFHHQGFDFEQINKAIASNRKNKQKIKGASTITQQLVKNIFLNKSKNYIRKAKEFYLTYWLEKNVSKLKILETYLNVVEFGKDLYGIKNASKFYFKKDPKYLTPREAAFLAMLLPSPKKYSKSYYKKELTPYAFKTVTDILFKMRMSGYISEQMLQAHLATPLSFESNPMKYVEEIQYVESSTDELLDENDDDESHYPDNDSRDN